MSEIDSKKEEKVHHPAMDQSCGNASTTTENSEMESTASRQHQLAMVQNKLESLEDLISNGNTNEINKMENFSAKSPELDEHLSLLDDIILSEINSDSSVSSSFLLNRSSESIEAEDEAELAEEQEKVIAHNEYDGKDEEKTDFERRNVSETDGLVNETAQRLKMKKRQMELKAQELIETLNGSPDRLTTNSMFFPGPSVTIRNRTVGKTKQSSNERQPSSPKPAKSDGNHINYSDEPCSPQSTLSEDQGLPLTPTTPVTTNTVSSQEKKNKSSYTGQEFYLPEFTNGNSGTNILKKASKTPLRIKTSCSLSDDNDVDVDDNSNNNEAADKNGVVEKEANPVTPVKVTETTSNQKKFKISFK